MNSTKILALLFGLGFITLGVLGYMPDYVPNGKLFGYFEVDSMHNIFHIGCGIFALLVALSTALSKVYFEVIGIIFSIMAIAGFMFSGNLYLMHANTPDNILNLSIAVVALYIGFLHNNTYD